MSGAMSAEERTRRGPERFAVPVGLLLAGCGPTDEVVGVSIVSSLVLLVPAAAGLNVFLHRLWRGSRPLAEPSVPEAAAVWLAVVALAALLNALIARASEEIVLVSCWVVGATYLTLFSSAIGVALARGRPWAFRLLYWLPAVPVLLLALPFVLGSQVEELKTVCVQALIGVGGLGVIGVPLFLILLGASIRSYVRRRACELAPPLGS
jgi:hypothetical protein